MNGIDTAEWDPATDARLPPDARYSAATVAEGKARAKALLQERLGLRLDPSAPLVGFVGRLTEQKGVDVLLGAAPALLAAPPAPAPAPAPTPVPVPTGLAVPPSSAGCDCEGESSTATAEAARDPAADVSTAAPASVAWAEDPGGPGEFAPPASSSGARSWLEGRGRRRSGGRQPGTGPRQCCLSPAQGNGGLAGREGAGAGASSRAAWALGVTNLVQPASLAVPAGDELGDDSCQCCGRCDAEAGELSAEPPVGVHPDAAEAVAAAAEPDSVASGDRAPGSGGLQLVVLGTGEVSWVGKALLGWSLLHSLLRQFIVARLPEAQGVARSHWSPGRSCSPFKIH
jgi:hypothetical protein